MTDNFANYALLKDDDPFEECRDWFWATLGADEVLPKYFLEELMEIMRRIDAGEEELVAVNIEDIAELQKLIEEVEDGNV